MSQSKILYVDDEETNLINFKMAFQDHFEIFTALSGPAAQELFRENSDIAIVVADQKMTGMTGVQLLTILHNLAPEPIRIILTAYSDARDIIDAINQGRIYEYILKPWEEENLLLTLKKAEELFLLAGENRRLLEELQQKNQELKETNERLLADMKKRKETEKALFAKQVELAHAGRLAALGEMASGMAHEIHQPLTVIQLDAENLQFYFSRRKQKSLEAESVQDILAQVKRAGKIINHVRAFSRSDFGGMQCIDPFVPVDNALSFFRQQFRAKNIELKEEIKDVPEIKTDPQKLEQVVVNFLSNAGYAVMKQAEKNPANYRKRVIIRLFSGQRPACSANQFNEDQCLIFEVEDNGIGMIKQIKEHCLEPFYTTKEVGEGTGLGLSIAHGIARELRMKLEIESTPSRGSLFRLLIPLNGC
ncbi:MAG: response regulator [Desulfobulbaceae bacterium]|nr:response regulator [Desulfobulbaceae bacterium]